MIYLCLQQKSYFSLSNANSCWLIGPDSCPKDQIKSPFSFTTIMQLLSQVSYEDFIHIIYSQSPGTSFNFLPSIFPFSMIPHWPVKERSLTTTGWNFLYVLSIYLNGCYMLSSLCWDKGNCVTAIVVVNDLNFRPNFSSLWRNYIDGNVIPWAIVLFPLGVPSDHLETLSPAPLQLFAILPLNTD